MNASHDCLKDIDIAILAGGLGTRIESVLDETPKILAPVGERPFLSFLLDWLAKYGARRVVLGLGHLAHAVIDYLDGRGPDGIQIVPVIEPDPLGTAGALRFMKDRLRSDPVLVINGDSFVDVDLCDFVVSHAASNAEVSLICTELENTSHSGRVSVSEQGRIIDFIEKDIKHEGPGFINAGVYLFSAAMLSRIEKTTGSSLEHDVFEMMAPETLHAMTGQFRFIDIGTPESLATATEVISSCSW